MGGPPSVRIMGRPDFAAARAMAAACASRSSGVIALPWSPAASVSGWMPSLTARAAPPAAPTMAPLIPPPPMKPMAAPPAAGAAPQTAVPLHEEQPESQRHEAPAHGREPAAREHALEEPPQR